MEIIKFLFDSAFAFLNLQLTIPLNFAGNERITFPLYFIVIALFIIEIIKVIWSGVMYSNTDIE